MLGAQHSAGGYIRGDGEMEAMFNVISSPLVTPFLWNLCHSEGSTQMGNEDEVGFCVSGL